MQFRICFFILLSYIAVFLCSCRGGLPGSPVDSSRFGNGSDKIRIMTYNTQTFFDATECGSEFAEFRGKSSRWSVEKYSARLDRLREVLLLCGVVSGMGSDRGPDIAVLQEIENASVLQDLCNRLPLRSRYAGAVFVPGEKGSSFGTALLSRFPVVSVTAHSVSSPGTALRPLLEIMLDIGGRRLVVFAIHWKSKVGKNDTGAIRLEQEGVLEERIQELKECFPDVPFIACGDFNEPRDEFSVPNGLVDCWDDWFAQCDNAAVAGPPGSYWYGGSWETIDHFLYPAREYAGFRVHDFRVVSDAPLVDAASIPSRYEVFSGKGYSDHLPLLLEVEWKK